MATEWVKGASVRVHPATDLFMRGVVSATIATVGSKWLHLHHPLSGTKHKVSFAWAERNLTLAYYKD